MALSSAAEQELRNMLRAFRAAHAGVVTPVGQGKALEAYVLLKLAQTVRRRLHSWTVSLRRGDGRLVGPGQPFNLPQTRTPIQPPHPQAPGYVLLSHRSAPHLHLELHCSLQWQGRSGAKHECDVSVVPAVIADALRVGGGGYPRGLPVAAVECKDKGGVGTLDETRQTLARMFDLSLVTQPAFHAVGRIYEAATYQTWGRRRTRYITAFAAGAFSIVRAGTFQSGAAVLASHYAIQHHPQIYTNPRAVEALESDFRTVVSRASSI